MQWESHVYDTVVNGDQVEIFVRSTRGDGKVYAESYVLAADADAATTQELVDAQTAKLVETDPGEEVQDEEKTPAEVEGEVKEHQSAEKGEEAEENKD